MLLGEAYQSGGDIVNAKTSYQAAKQIATSIGDRTNAKIHIVWCRHLKNDNTGVIDKLNKICHADLDLSVKGTLLYVLGCIHRVLAHFEKAEEMLHNACQVFSELGNKIKFDICQSELGRVYRATGDFSKALELQKELYQSALKRGDIANLGISCSLLSFTYQYYRPLHSSNPDLNLSVQYLAVGMQLSIEVGAKDNAGWCLNNIAKAYIKGKHFHEALQLCKKRLAIAKETGNTTGEGTAYGNAGLACRGLGEYNQAAEYHRSYLKIVGERYLDKAWMEHELALDYMLLGDYECALEYALHELSTNSTIQSHYNTTCASDKSKVANFEKNHARCFNLLQYILVEMGKHEVALVYADIGRALSISDLFSSKHHLPSGCYSRSNNQAETLNTSFVKQLIDYFHEIVNRLNAVLVFYSLIDLPIEYDKEENILLYTWVIFPESSNVHFTQQHLLKSDVSLFRVLCGREHEYFQDASLATYAPSQQHDTDRWLRDIVLSANTSTEEDSSTYHVPCIAEMDEVLVKLYSLLIQPFEHHLHIRIFKKIIFIPHKSLMTVPFSALKNTDNCSLISRFVVSISLSIHLLEQTVAVMTKHLKEDSSGALVVGNPSMPSAYFNPLPGSEIEAIHIAELLAQSKQTVLLCGTAATKNAVIHHIERSTVIHLATHAFEEDPFNHTSSTPSVAYDDFSNKGTIVLAKSDEGCSGMLTSLEVQNMMIPAELVVLSCCKTAQGRVTHEGTLGLSRAFISAGSGAVLVTLWSIPDLHTAELMKRFYACYVQSRDAASALQQAMLHMNSELHLDFGYWGAFSLVGITPGYFT